MKKIHLAKLKAFTLAEIMTVLLIIGFLMVLAIPIFDDLFSETYSIEAKNQLKYLEARQQNFYQKKFRYSDSLKEIGFTAPQTLDEEGEARYNYEIVSAGKDGFIAQAVAIADFDQDGNVNVWQIDSKGKLMEVTPD